MLENKYIAQAFEVILPSIRVNKKLYIPMLDELITRDNIDKLRVFENEFNIGVNVRKKVNRIL